MKQIRIERKQRKFRFALPESPEQLTSEEWLFIYHMQSMEISGLDLKLAFLLKKMKTLPQNVIQGIGDEEIAELCKIIDFVEGEIHPAKCPLNQVAIKRANFAAPASLDEITGAEYALIESCFVDMAELKDDFYLYKIMAILYRPTNYLGKRKPFDDSTLEDRANLFKGHLGIEYAWLVSDWYKTWHTGLEEEYPEVFQGEESKIKSEGFVEVIYSMAGAKLGLISAVMELDIKSILLAATLEIKNNKRIKAASKRN
jgi:hypothetical protein